MSPALVEGRLHAAEEIEEFDRGEVERRRPDARKRYTVEEFETLSGTKGYELVGGELVEKQMGSESDLVSVSLIAVLHPFVRKNHLGFVGGPEAGFVLPLEHGPQLRKPDVSFVARGRYPDDRPPRKYARLAPDFAFESVSPTDVAEDVQEKVEEYLRAGVRLVWVAYPKSQVVLAFRPDGSVQRFAAADPLRADDLFPGFACPAAELFAVV